MKRLDEFLTKYFSRLFWILVGIFFSLYLLLIGGDYVWTDEAYSFAMVKHSFSEIWTITGEDVHPPLYYWYLKVIIAPFHYDMRAAKIASILPYMFIIMWGGKRLKNYFNERTAVLFMAMFFCFPFALPYSIEIRMYSLAAAFVFACAIYAYQFWIEQGTVRAAAGLVISGVLGAYTHYYALVSVGIIYVLLFVLLLVRRRHLGWKWLASAAISVILYLPWLPSLFHQIVYVNNDYWIPEITIRTILGYIYRLFGADGLPAYAVFLSAAYLICFIWVLSAKEKNDIILCICCILVPMGTLAVGVLASIIVRPVFIIRYIIPSIPILVIFMAFLLGKTKNLYLFSSILMIVFIGGISNYGVTLYSEYTTHNYLQIDEYKDVDAYIVVGNGHVADVLGYYVTEQYIYYDTVTAGNPFINILSMDEFDSDHVERAILLADAGDTILDEDLKLYDIVYLGQWKCEIDADAYLLTKKL
jgi:uncharacterized membrane protein